MSPIWKIGKTEDGSSFYLELGFPQQAARVENLTREQAEQLSPILFEIERKVKWRCQKAMRVAIGLES